MNAQPSELQSLRGRFFFWIGLVILPVFWVWWMRPAYFSRTQRRAGWVWTACYVAALLIFRQQVGQRMDVLVWAYPVVAEQLGLTLWLWLLFRVFRILGIMSLVVIDLLGSVSTLIGPALHHLEPSAAIVLFPVIPAALHLLIEPVRGGWRRIQRRYLESDSTVQG